MAERPYQVGSYYGPDIRLEKRGESPASRRTARAGEGRCSYRTRGSAPRKGTGWPVLKEGESPPNDGPSSAGETLRRLVGWSSHAEERRKSSGGKALTAGPPRCGLVEGTDSPTPVRREWGTRYTRPAAQASRTGKPHRSAVKTERI